jgi:hypothetical protein
LEQPQAAAIPLRDSSRRCTYVHPVFTPRRGPTVTVERPAGRVDPTVAQGITAALAAVLLFGATVVLQARCAGAGSRP